MSENDALYLAQEFLARMGSGAEPCESDARIQSSLRYLEGF